METHHILLVDDEANILKSLTRLLKGEGYAIVTANSGEEGLEILRNQKIDLVISDQKMGGMSGIEFLEKTVEGNPELIRIILTGYGELNDAVRAINDGCVYKFILKPWNNDDLKITVRRALEQRDLLLSNLNLNFELKKRDVLLQELERKYPGITQRPEDGVFEIRGDE